MLIQVVGGVPVTFPRIIALGFNQHLDLVYSSTCPTPLSLTVIFICKLINVDHGVGGARWLAVIYGGSLSLKKQKETDQNK